jgi:hypothetical protein
MMFLFVMALPGMLKPGEDAEEPMGLLCGAFMFPVVINLGYSLGYVAERRLNKRLPGRDWATPLYRAGLVFTGCVLFLPGVLSLIIYWVRR